MKKRDAKKLEKEQKKLQKQEIKLLKENIHLKKQIEKELLKEKKQLNKEHTKLLKENVKLKKIYKKSKLINEIIDKNPKYAGVAQICDDTLVKIDEMLEKLKVKSQKSNVKKSDLAFVRRNRKSYFRILRFYFLTQRSRNLII